MNHEERKDAARARLGITDDPPSRVFPSAEGAPEPLTRSQAERAALLLHKRGPA